MATTVLMAKFLGPFMVVVSLGLLLNVKTYQKVMEDFFKNTAIVYIGGAMAFFMGLAIVLFHNVWVAGWPVIITFFGWAGLVKGVWLIAIPNIRGRITETYQKHPGLLMTAGVVWFIFGLFLSYKGYFTG